MNNEISMKHMVDDTYLDFSIIDDDMLPPLNLKARDEVDDKDKGKGHENKTLIEPQEQRRQVLVQKYGTRCPRNFLKSFPITLMKLLSRDDLQEYISWLPHGRAFFIHQPDAFVDNVLVAYFKMTKFRSFTRQLNIWDFKRITYGRDAGAYYHELFLRGRPKLALFIRRHEIKGICTKLPSNHSKVPHFYEMTAMEPLPHCKDPPVVSLESTALKTDDTLPKSTEKSTVTSQSAASYHSQTGSVGNSNTVHGSHCLQPNVHTEHQDEADPSSASRMVLETVALEQQRQKIIEFLQQTSQDSLRQAQQALAQHKAMEDLLQGTNGAINTPDALPAQNYLRVPLQFNNCPQNFYFIAPTSIEFASSRLLNLITLPAIPAIPLSLMALQQQPTTEER